MKRTEDVCIETLKNRMTNKNEKKAFFKLFFQPIYWLIPSIHSTILLPENRNWVTPLYHYEIILVCIFNPSLMKHIEDERLRRLLKKKKYSFPPQLNNGILNKSRSAFLQHDIQCVTSYRDASAHIYVTASETRRRPRLPHVDFR